MAILASFSGYPFQEMDMDAIFVELQNTNDEENRWGNYFFQGPQYEMTIHYAKDAESDIIHLKIKAPRELTVQIQTLKKIEGMVKKLELQKGLF